MSSEFQIMTALACWAVWGIFEKQALKYSGEKDVGIMLYVLHIMQIPVILILLNMQEPGWHLTATSMTWSGLASCSYAIALMAYLTALSRSEASFVLGSTACYPVISLVLSTCFLGEKFVMARLIGAAVAVVGIFAMGMQPKGNGPAQQIPKSVLLCVVIATVAWGVWGVIDKRAVSIASPLEIYLGKCIWDIFFLIIVSNIMRMQGHKFNLRSRQSWLYCGLSTVCLAFGGIAYLTALSRFSASYVIAITACYPVLMYILALFFLKERFNKYRFVGLSLAVLGAILVQTTQSL